MEEQEKKHHMILTEEEARWVIGMDSIKRASKANEAQAMREYRDLEKQNHNMQRVISELIFKLNANGTEISYQELLATKDVGGSFLLMDKWYNAEELREAIKSM